jgi:hypothetical protein
MFNLQIDQMKIVDINDKKVSNFKFTLAYDSPQGLPILTVGTSMAVTITHVFLWGSSATNHIENALIGSP